MKNKVWDHLVFKCLISKRGIKIKKLKLWFLVIWTLIGVSIFLNQHLIGFRSKLRMMLNMIQLYIWETWHMILRQIIVNLEMIG